MPVLVFFMVGLFLISGLFAITLASIRDECWRIFIFTFVLLLGFTTFYIQTLRWYANQPPILGETQILTVQTYEDFDSVIYNKRFINLNKLFGKDFEVGDTVKVTEKLESWHGWLYDMSEYAIIEHGEDSVKYYD